MSTDLRSWVRALPKAELHVHLEGTVSPVSLRRIAQRNGLRIASDAGSLYACRDFASFLAAFLRVVDVLRRPLDFAEVAYEYLEASSACGVRHVEFMLSPATQRLRVPELNLDTMIRAVADACERAESAFGVSSVLVFDMVRNLGSAAALQDIELALRHRPRRIIGVGLGGDEKNFPVTDFVRAFQLAGAAGLRLTVHAGEAAGAQSIVDAVELLHAQRIGHAVAARGRPDVLALLRRRGVAVDACISSNYVTGAVGAGEPHPLLEFVESGLQVSVNSDDPAFFGTSLVDEYLKAAALGLSPAQLAALAANSVRASFAPAAAKQRWLADLNRYPPPASVPTGQG